MHMDIDEKDIAVASVAVVAPVPSMQSGMPMTLHVNTDTVLQLTLA